jgi:hypothetical protein
MVVEVFRSEACAEDSDEGNESFAITQEFTWFNNLSASTSGDLEKVLL